MEKILQVAKRDGKHIMCIEMDLDGLKRINDTYGHDAGDNAIVQIANAMRQASERREVCIRSGGDEFLVFGIAERKVMQDHLSAEWRIVLMSITAGISGRIRLRAAVDIMYAVPVRSILLRRW